MHLPPGYSISPDRALLDLDTVHSWLTNSYWSPGVSRDLVERAAVGASLVLGAYFEPQDPEVERPSPVPRHPSPATKTQVGYLRVVSDRATFAWVCDVFVSESHRGKGLAKALVRRALEDPEHQGLRRWVLATKDAHAIYAVCGFMPLEQPERWMAMRAKSAGNPT